MKMLQTFLTRPELQTLLVTLVMAGLGRLAPQFAIPEATVSKIVGLFATIFVAAVVEGKFKGAAYVYDWTSLLRSSKMRLGLISVLAVVVNAALAPLGYGIEEGVIADFINAAFIAVGGMAGLDAYTAATAPK